MLSFAGWSFLGNGAYLLNTQGVNILMNMFFGVAVNAARGIAGQVDSAVQSFVVNFTTAMNPQIIKSYAAGDLNYMHTLVCRGAKYSYFMTFFFCCAFGSRSSAGLVYLVSRSAGTCCYVRSSHVAFIFSGCCC